MLRKSTLLAFVATAALGLAMLNPVTASARGGHGGGGHGGGHHGGGHHGGGHHGGGMHRGGHHGHHHGHHHRHHGHHHRHHFRHHYVRWHRPIWYAAPVSYATYAAQPAVAGPCTCLTKEYTPEGSVLFKDRCTNEMAMYPPVQAPQQTSMVEPQPQVTYAPQPSPQFAR